MVGKAKVRQAVKKPQEPKWEHDRECSNLDVMETLSWYNINKNYKDAAKILGCDLTTAKYFETLAWSKRMIANGFRMTEKHLASIGRMQKEIGRAHV